MSVVNATCTYDGTDNDVWRVRPYIDTEIMGTVYKLQNVEHGTCIVVQNASLANNAFLITHSCETGGDNHFWVF